jgi:hypothetical protein
VHGRPFRQHGGRNTAGKRARPAHDATRPDRSGPQGERQPSTQTQPIGRAPLTVALVVRPGRAPTADQSGQPGSAPSERGPDAVERRCLPRPYSLATRGDCQAQTSGEQSARAGGRQFARGQPGDVVGGEPEVAG